MKVKIDDIANKNSMISHLILESIGAEALSTITPLNERSLETTVELEVLFNGVSLDVSLFFKQLELQHDTIIKRAANVEALELFEKYKKDYNSKNSSNAKIEKINKQFNKVNQQLLNIKKSIDLL